VKQAREQNHNDWATKI